MFEKAKARALGSERKTDTEPWRPQSFPAVSSAARTLRAVPAAFMAWAEPLLLQLSC